MQPLDEFVLRPLRLRDRSGEHVAPRQFRRVPVDTDSSQAGHEPDRLVLRETLDEARVFSGIDPLPLVSRHRRVLYRALPRLAETKVLLDRWCAPASLPASVCPEATALRLP